MLNPMDQFKVKELFPIELVGYNVSFTNVSLWMTIALITIVSLLTLGMRRKLLVPTKLQSISEMLFEMVEGMLEGSIGEKGKKFVPSIFCVFMFILTCNLLGMLPIGFTVTSHIAVTFSIAVVVFVVITICGFCRHGLHYLSLFLPQGTPLLMAPLMIFIEFFAYLVRPVSLSLRLAANMTAGHIVLKVIASFVIMAGVVGVLPFALLTVLIGFEFFIAILQAYIFTILTCAYLNDAVNLH